MNDSDREVGSFDELYPGVYLKSGELRGNETVTISRVVRRPLEGERGVEEKTIVEFSDAKPLVACKTNGLCIKAMFGANVREWYGKRIVLFMGEANLRGKQVPAVRIYGSPDIAADIDVPIALKKRKTFMMTMHATGAAGVKNQGHKSPVGQEVQQHPKLAANVTALLERMAAAVTPEDLADVREDLVTDDTLTERETAFLSKHFNKHKARVEGRPGA